MLRIHLSALNHTMTNMLPELRQVEAARRALMLTKAKYDAGYTNYLEVLIAESYTFDAEMLAFIYKRTTAYINCLSLQGPWGGW